MTAIAAARTVVIHAPRMTTSRASITPVVQTGTLTFARSATVGVDSSVKLSDVSLEAATTRLTVHMSLAAGRQYSFAGGYTAGMKVTLTGPGTKATINLTKGFTVKTTGEYDLTFDAPYSLKNAGSVSSLSINSKAVLPTSSGDKNIDALLRGGTDGWWHAYDAAPATGTTQVSATAKGLAANSSATALTYSFLSGQPQGQNMSGFQPMTEAQKSAVRAAFDYYSKLINVTFTEAQDGSAGNINFGTNDQAHVSAGYASPPNGSAAKDETFLFLANDAATNGDAGVQTGGYGWETILHEIGHTLGLKHPGNYNAGGGGTPGPYLSATVDDRQHTIMSYKNDAASTGVNPSTAMVYDIEALQYLYGANTSASTATNGAFSFADGNQYLQTLWSANGTDTIDLGALKNSSNVDLNGGAYSSINITGAADSAWYSGRNNVGIAYGSAINKVTLSSAEDVAESVTLNDAYANGAFDAINGFDAGDDTINIKKSMFKSVTAKNIEFGASATKATSKLVVNPTTGEVFYDADGSGTKSVARKIAQLNLVDGSAPLSLSNFSFVA